MEGLNDGRAVKMIVPQVNPRKMVGNYVNSTLYMLMVLGQIIVHAQAAAADALIDSCANIRSMTRDIYAPSVGETVQIGQHTNSFSISLSDELLSTIKMSRVSFFLKFPVHANERLVVRR
jgi:cleavage and polyadenylation specificity factor subunit 2